MSWYHLKTRLWNTKIFSLDVCHMRENVITICCISGWGSTTPLHSSCRDDLHFWCFSYSHTSSLQRHHTASWILSPVNLDIRYIFYSHQLHSLHSHLRFTTLAAEGLDVCYDASIPDAWSGFPHFSRRYSRKDLQTHWLTRQVILPIFVFKSPP